MALTFYRPRGVLAEDAAGYFRPTGIGGGVQVNPAEGASATVHYTLTDPSLWGEDGSGAIWEPAPDGPTFSSQQTIHFDVVVAGVRVVAADGAVTVDVLGGRA